MSSEEPGDLKTALFVSGYKHTNPLESLAVTVSNLAAVAGSSDCPLLTFMSHHGHPSITGPEDTAGAPVTAELEFCIPSPCGCRRQNGLVERVGKTIRHGWTLCPDWEQLPN